MNFPESVLFGDVSRCTAPHVLCCNCHLLASFISIHERSKRFLEKSEKILTKQLDLRKKLPKVLFLEELKDKQAKI
jgi:hypothetical protein